MTKSKETKAQALIEQARQLATEAEQIPKITVANADQIPKVNLENLRTINRKFCNAQNLLNYAALLLKTDVRSMLIAKNEGRLRLLEEDLARSDKQIEAEKAKLAIRKLLTEHPLKPMQIDNLAITKSVADKLQKHCATILKVEPKNKDYRNCKKQTKKLLEDIERSKQLLNNVEYNLFGIPLTCAILRGPQKGSMERKSLLILKKHLQTLYQDSEIQNLYIKISSSEQLEKLQEQITNWIIPMLKLRHSFMCFKSNKIKLFNFKSLEREDFINWINGSIAPVSKNTPKQLS